MKVYCPHCQQKYNLEESLLGQEIQCQVCSGSMIFEAPAPPVLRPPSPSLVVKSPQSSKGPMFAALAVMIALGAGFFFFIHSNSKPEVSDSPVVIHVVDEEAPESVPTVSLPVKKTPVAPVLPEIVVQETMKPVEPEITLVPPPRQESVIDQAGLGTLFKTKVQPFFEQHCVACHGPKKEKGSLRVDQLVANLDDNYTLSHLQNIIDEMTLDNMPPEDEPRPDSNEVVEVMEVLTGLVQAAKDKHSAGGGRPVRRLTRSEFVNTVWDQLGVHVDGANLPDDLLVGNFETNSETLFMTDMHIRLYLDKAREVVKRFIESRENKPGTHVIPVDYSPALMQSKFAFNASAVPPAGYLMVRGHWWVRDTQDRNLIHIGPAEQQGDFIVSGTKSAPQTIDFKVWRPDRNLAWEIKKTKTPSKNLGAGLSKKDSKKRIARLGDYSLTGDTLVKAQERMFLHPVVLGKIEHVQVVSRQPFEFFEPFLRRGDRLADSAAPAIIREFASMVKRGRPADMDYVARLSEVFKQGRKQGMSFWEALEEPLAISMCSLETMLHFEDRSPSKRSRTISGTELANRLSYTLWRSAPDAELLRLGKSGKLLDQGVKAQQVQRMMADSKFDRFLNDFSDQWFELPRQDEIAVDQRVYKKFDVKVKPAMKQESIAFMSYLVRENLPLINLVDSDFMMLNETMAKFYQIPGVEGDEFRPVKRKGSKADQIRGGILTHAGILMQGGTGDRSSIVERGAFVARKLINKPPAPPPPNAGELPTNEAKTARMTGAQLVKHHASALQCANCHAKIDPLGMGLEEFDAIGQFRTKETRLNPMIDKLNKRQRKDPKNFVITVPLDKSGRLYDGQHFDGVQELKHVLMSKKHDLARGYIKALLAYANGREVNLADEAIVDKIVSQTASSNYPARLIIEKLALSEIMTKY